MSLVVMGTADASVALQFGKLANAVVIVMLCFYAIVGIALFRLGPLADAGLGKVSQWLGAASVGISMVIIAMQDWFTIAAAGSLVIGCAMVRLTAVLIQRPSSSP